MLGFPTVPFHGTCTTVRGVIIISPWILHLLGTDLLLSALLPFSFLFPSQTYDVSSYLAASVWHSIQRVFKTFNGATISTSGTELPYGDSAIVISNHISWTDFHLIQHLAIKAGMLSRCRWFAKQQLKWVPFLGWGLWVMGMPLVTRNWTQDQKEMERVFQGIKKNKWPICATAPFLTA